MVRDGFVELSGGGVKGLKWRGETQTRYWKFHDERYHVSLLVT
jgi:hypothetical protein